MNKQTQAIVDDLFNENFNGEIPSLFYDQIDELLSRINHEDP